MDEVLTKQDTFERSLADPYRFLLEDGGVISLYDFLQMFWDEASTDNFKTNWHIPYICEELERLADDVGNNRPAKKELIINVPPGTTKTMMCSVMFPAWCWTRWPHMKFITASYSASLSLESAEKSRDLIRSEKFQRLYPHLGIREDKDKKSNFELFRRVPGVPGKSPRTVKGGNRFSTSVGGTLTGYHGHILIIDDPLNPEQAASEKELENCNNWMEQTLPTRKVDKVVANQVLIMQRLHQNDPTGRALNKKKERIQHICLPGEIRNYKKYLSPKAAEMNYVDGLLDPERLSWQVLKNLEADLGQYGFAGQVGQNPTPPGGGMFKVDNFVYIDESSQEFKPVQKVRYWDKAGTIEDGAYTAGVKIYRLRNGKFVIVDVIRGQWSSDHRERIMRNQAEADGRDVRIGIEQEPGSSGKESAQASILNLAGYSAVADRPSGNKEFRADPFSVQVNNGNVYLVRGDWNHAYLEELEMFPFGTYKDQVDASSGAFNMIAAKKQVRVIR